MNPFKGVKGKRPATSSRERPGMGGRTAKSNALTDPRERGKSGKCLGGGIQAQGRNLIVARKKRGWGLKGLAENDLFNVQQRSVTSTKPHRCVMIEQHLSNEKVGNSSRGDGT